MTDKQKPSPTSRDKLNRVLGPSSYAGAVLITAFLIWSIIDTLKAKGVAGLKQDIQTLAIIAAVAIVMFTVGFTTGRSPSK